MHYNFCQLDSHFTLIACPSIKRKLHHLSSFLSSDYLFLFCSVQSVDTWVDDTVQCNGIVVVHCEGGLPVTVAPHPGVVGQEELNVVSDPPILLAMSDSDRAVVL